MLNHSAAFDNTPKFDSNDSEFSLDYNDGHSPQQLYDDFCLEQDPSDFVCPHCQIRGHFKPDGSYSRYFYNSPEDVRNGTKIRLNIYRCQCGHRHTLMPEWLCPFSSFSMPFLRVLLFDYYGSLKQNKSRTASKYGLTYRQVFLVVTRLESRTMVQEMTQACAELDSASLSSPAMQTDSPAEQPARCHGRMSVKELITVLFCTNSLFLNFIRLFLRCSMRPFLTPLFVGRHNHPQAKWLCQPHPWPKMALT